ncbi:MAG: PAS domain-containing protein [Candidatus Hodarchaeales archaeon]|jgi:PAS domain S-box-containing protein
MKDKDKSKEQLITELVELRNRVKEFGISEVEYQKTIESLRIFEKAIVNMQLGVTISDLERKILYSNASDATMHGYTVDELIGQDVRVFAPSKLWNPVNFEKIISHKSWDRESINIKKDKSLFPVKLRSDVFTTAEGQPISIITTCEDITQLQKIEKEHSKLFDVVSKGKLEWEMTFDNASELMILVDKDLNIIRCNKSFADFTQKPIKSLVGKKFTDFLSSNSNNVEYKKADGKTEIKTETGQWLHLSYHPIMSEKEDFQHSILIGSDITELKNIQQKLIKSENELKERVEELERFYESAVGREVKMKNLKNEIEKLKEERSKHKK